MRIAIDIVLVPDEEFCVLAVQLNRQLLEQEYGCIRLGRRSGECVPHVSLCMGTLDEKELAKLERRLTEVAPTDGPLELRAIELDHIRGASGQEVSSLRVAPDRKLTRLHEEIMRVTEKQLGTKPKAKMLVVDDDDSADSGSLKWIEEYRDKHAFKRFDPHVTLGFGRIEAPRLPRHFQAMKLAVYQLGNGCTCRRRLLEIHLDAASTVS